MSVTAKLWGGFIATLVLGAVLVYQLSVIRQLAAANERLANISSRVAVVGTEQLYRLDQLAESSAKFRVTEDPRYAERFVLLNRRIVSGFGDLDTLSVTTAEREHVDRISRTLERLETVGGALAEAVEGGAGASVAVDLAARSEAWIQDLRAETVQLTGAARAAMREEASRSAIQAANVERRAWLVAGLAILAGALVMLTAARSISGGLRRLAGGTRRVADGDLEYRLRGAREIEFRQLERDFNLMVERLSELDRMKKDFLAGISHDLKSPLASIRETLAVLLDEVPGPLTHRQQRLLDLAGQSAERLAGMISNLLELAQLEHGVIEYDFREQDLAALVEGIAAEMGTRLRERDVDIEMALPDREPVECDAGRMGQVVQNLLENALTVAPGGSAIRVALAADSVGRVRLTISDRGPGVPEEMAERIFDRFQRGSGRDSKGVGLGLTISREIVHAHGGRIRVEPRSGGGSDFVVEIPRGRGDAQLPAASAGRTPAADTDVEVPA